MNKQDNYRDHAVDFHLREYDSLRKEVESTVQETRTIERYALIGTGTLWAWLATHKDVPPPEIIWWFQCYSLYWVALDHGHY